MPQDDVAKFFPILIHLSHIPNATVLIVDAGLKGYCPPVLTTSISLSGFLSLALAVFCCTRVDNPWCRYCSKNYSPVSEALNTKKAKGLM